MSVFQKYLRAVSKTRCPRRKNLTAKNYARVVQAWRDMTRGSTSPFENLYLHDSYLDVERKILLALSSESTRALNPELSALHYLETLSELDVLHVNHVGLQDRLALKIAVQDPAMNLSLRNQTSNTIAAFGELRKAAKELGAIEVDLYARLEDPAQYKLAEKVDFLIPYGKHWAAMEKAENFRREILRRGFKTIVDSDLAAARRIRL